MKERRGLSLCTFEVATHLGRCARVGALDSGRIVDLNFATAWYMQETGEADAQRFADGIVPANMADFLRAGQRAQFTAEELFLGAGPPPAEWWLKENPPRGPNCETLVYRPEEVRLLAPLPGPRVVAPGEDLPFAGEWEPRLAAIVWKRADAAPANRAREWIFGFTLLHRCGRYSAMGPLLATPARVPADAVITVRINGEERGQATAAGIEALVTGAETLLPGDAISLGIPVSGAAPRKGDMVEMEMDAVGVLRNRLA